MNLYSKFMIGKNKFIACKICIITSNFSIVLNIYPANLNMQKFVFVVFRIKTLI
jgi:hypothetical protein